MKNRNNILITALVILVVLLVAIVPTVLAFMFTKSNTVENQFEKAYVMAEVEEVYDKTGNQKSSIKIKNTGNVDAYLRLRFVSYWVGPDGTILGKPSEMPTIVFDDENWVKDGDTYYFKSKVKPGEQTKELLDGSNIKLNTVLSGESTTAYQVLEIIPEAVQADPSKAAGELWSRIQVNSSGEIELKPTPTLSPTPTPTAAPTPTPGT